MRTVSDDMMKKPHRRGLVKRSVLLSRQIDVLSNQASKRIATNSVWVVEVEAMKTTKRIQL